MMNEHEAQIHHVRIFVVPDAALEGEPPPVGRNELTDRHRRLAKAYANRTAPELQDDVKAIVVIGDKAATFLNRELVPHDRAIRHAAIRVFTESDIIEWRSDQPFTIVSTEKAEEPIWSVAGTPENPFYSGPPFESTVDPGNRHQARSSKTKQAANGQQYKVSIRLEDGRLVDPDYVCGDPPPP
jgi:hypothetical protein